MRIFASLFLIIAVTLSMSLFTPAYADDGAGCGTTYTKLTLDTSSENNFDFGKTGDVVLLEGTCSQLKSGACGTGTCEKGWHCKDTGIQCLCTPPE